MILPVLLLIIIQTVCQAQSFSDFKASVRESEISGLVGKSVRLPCEVDEDTCGVLHNIKWYKGNERVYIFSDVKQVSRPEGSLLQRGRYHYTNDSHVNWLEINPLLVKDESKYKCEVTYLSVKETCPLVQFVNLTTLARPTSYQLSFEDGTLIENGTKIGPFLEGDDLVLRCEAGGAKPVPSVKWSNGTQKLSGRFQSKIDRDGLFIGSNLIHLTLKRYDLGKTISCEIFNEAMPQPVTLTTTLDVDVSPSSVEIQVQRRVLQEGDMVELLCIVKGAKPPAMIEWKNGTTPILEAKTNANIQEEDSEIVHPDGTYETRSLLKFVGSRYESSVPFACETTNAVLEQKRFPRMEDIIEVDVHFPPTVRVHPENITINETANFLIHCEYTANPTRLTHVHWFLDDHQLDIEGQPEKYRYGNVDNPSLYVINGTANDMGAYTCRISNEVGVSNVTEPSYVSVQYPPEVSVIITPEGPISEETRPNVTLICDVIKAHPRTLSRVRWFLHGELLKELPECDDTMDDTSNFCDVTPTRLVLESVFREFHGNYTCEGMNEAGWGKRSDPAPLIVNYAPGDASLTYIPKNVIKGEPVSLTCNVNDVGRPEVANFIWTRNSHWVRNVTSKVWKIDSASLETEANFTCLPYNIEGNGTMASVEIDVLAKPTFIERLPPYHGALMNAEEVSLSCRVECSPLCEITWLKDNLLLDNNTHYRVLNLRQPPDPASGDMESIVSTLSWKMDQWPRRQLHRELDNANYTCTSSANAAGMGVISNTTFRVEYPPEDIFISHKLIQVIEGTVPDRINCFASSYPEPSYYWVHNDETVATGTVLDLAFEVERKLSGNYTCVAENKHGIVTSTALLDVMFKPECKITRQDSSTREASQILLICRAYANPDKVSFRWRVGNETLVDNILSAELESRLYLEGSTASLGTYYCYVNNTVGESIPCEIDVTGVSGIIETLGSDNVLLYILIVAAIIVVLIIIVIIMLCCLRQRQRGKYTEGTNLHKENTEAIISRVNPQNPPPNMQSKTLPPAPKWPLRPGVQVHINSLTSLTDDSKPLYNTNLNLNTNTNSTTISSGSYQLQHHNQLDSQSGGHQLQPKRGNISTLHRSHPSSTLDNNRSSTSSTGSSSSNLLPAKVNALHTLPHPPSSAQDVTRKRQGLFHPDHNKHVNHSTKLNIGQRPKSFLTEFTPIFNPVYCGPEYPSPMHKHSGNSKAPDSNKKGKGQKSDDNPDNPNDDPQFYENLPFHGIQAPPNKDDVNNSQSRPSSQLSHPSSSGYGSSRSQNRHGGTKVSKKTISFQQGNEEIPQRRNSLSFSSLRTPTINTAKNALARTAAYFSLRKSKRHPAVKRPTSQVTDESGVESTEDSLPHDDSASQKDTSFVTSEASHTISAQRNNDSIVVESTQTSILTVRPLPTGPQQSSFKKPIPDGNCLGIPILTSSPKRRQPNMQQCANDRFKEGSLPRASFRNDGKQSHQNLPPKTKTQFIGQPHGLLKPLLNQPSDMEYADVDYAAAYSYGPIPYKAASAEAAAEFKAKKEQEVTGVPPRPPRKI